ncbi:hypothetical protein H310_12774 [Aphanomyces invadans]|uniref:Uncharacterized protein n=1 Tax=Aphanomyces invadans TaxID=157072 RepID=A0A024TII1_9STRA|nr:hypothetical protein H310_12774 [Aphanomyces invadans]ETV93167.1 hypothetical protein H310_12774 [Aphanomyces invadans]|eukprot:XP_008878189.1 hypothetical protein H310_12774 [Aphanomyces invadans]
MIERPIGFERSAAGPLARGIPLQTHDVNEHMHFYHAVVLLATATGATAPDSAVCEALTEALSLPSKPWTIHNAENLPKQTCMSPRQSVASGTTKESEGDASIFGDKGMAHAMTRVGELEAELIYLHEDLAAVLAEMDGLKSMLQAKVKALAAENMELKLQVMELQVQHEIDQDRIASLETKRTAAMKAGHSDSTTDWQSTIWDYYDIALHKSKGAVEAVQAQSKEFYESHVVPSGTQVAHQASVWTKAAESVYTEHAAQRVGSVLDHVKTTVEEQYAAHAPSVKDAFSKVIAKVGEVFDP